MVNSFAAERVMDRRSFLSSWVAGTAAAALSRRVFGSNPAGRKFKLGITNDEVTQDLEGALRFCREFDLGWIEIRNLWKQYVTDLPLEDVRRAKRLLDEAGVKLSVLDTALFKCALPGMRAVGNRKDDYPFSEQQPLLERAIERSQILDTRFIRIFSFWRMEEGDAARPRVIEELNKAAALAARAGRVLLIENVNGGVAETSAETARLLREIPSASVAMAWDPNNAFCGGEKRPYPDGYALLDRSRLHHIHLRDARQNEQTGRCEWVPTGKGEIDNLGLLRALVKDGF
jgi:sugar phosphate isomerase/epimerase